MVLLILKSFSHLAVLPPVDWCPILLKIIHFKTVFQAELIQACLDFALAKCVRVTSLGLFLTVVTAGAFFQSLPDQSQATLFRALPQVCDVIVES